MRSYAAFQADYERAAERSDAITELANVLDVDRDEAEEIYHRAEELHDDCMDDALERALEERAEARATV